MNCPDCLLRDGTIVPLNRTETETIGYWSCPTPKCGYTYTIYDYTILKKIWP